MQSLGVPSRCAKNVLVVVAIFAAALMAGCGSETTSTSAFTPPSPTAFVITGCYLISEQDAAQAFGGAVAAPLNSSGSDCGFSLPNDANVIVVRVGYDPTLGLYNRNLPGSTPVAPFGIDPAYTRNGTLTVASKGGVLTGGSQGRTLQVFVAGDQTGRTGSLAKETALAKIILARMESTLHVN